MLVTFECKAYADITYFGDVARSLLKMMGHSGTVPGALLSQDVPGALERLKHAIEAVKAEQSSVIEGKEDTDAQEPQVQLATRALPLIELLTAAAKNNCNVMWHQS